MDTRTRSILTTALRDGPAALGADDLAHLATVSSGPGPDAAADDTARPLWTFLRRRLFRFSRLLGGSDFYFYDHPYTILLKEAGAEVADDHGTHALLAAPVTEAGLRRAVKRCFIHEDSSVRTAAFQVTGLAGFADLAPALVNVLAGRGEGSHYEFAEMASEILRSLTVLEYEGARELGLRHLEGTGEDVQRAAFKAVLCGPGTPTDDELAKAMRTKFELDSLPLAPELFQRAVETGALRGPRLMELVDDGWVDDVSAMVVADLIVRGPWKKAFREQLKEEWSSLATACFVQVIGGPDWTAERVMELHRAGELDLDSAARCAALAWACDDGQRREMLASDDGDMYAGAALALLARNEALPQEALEPRVRYSDTAQWALGALLAARSNDPGLVEAYWSRLILEADKSLMGLIGRAWTQGGWELPEVMRLGQALMTPGAVLSEEELDELGALGRRHEHLLARLFSASEEASGRAALLADACQLTSLVDPLERQLGILGDEPSKELTRALLGLGGPQRRYTQLKQDLEQTEYNRTARVEREDLGIALMLAVGGGWSARRAATQALVNQAAAAAPHVDLLLARNEDDEQERAFQTVGESVAGPAPLVRDMGRILRQDAQRLDDLWCPGFISVKARDELKNALATTLSRLEREDDAREERIAQLLGQLLSDYDSSGAALGALVDRYGKRPDGTTADWVVDLVLAFSRDSSRWDAGQDAARAARRIPNVRFVPRLVELVAEDDGDAVDEAMAALKRIAELFPEQGLITVDLRQPSNVQETYGLTESYDWEADDHSEALRLLLIALEKRGDAGLAAEHAGRKVMLSRAEAIEAGHAGAGGWSMELFEQLALFLSVVFVDDDSGTIIAEVGQEPTGEVVNALLHTSRVGVARVAWS